VMDTQCAPCIGLLGCDSGGSFYMRNLLWLFSLAGVFCGAHRGVAALDPARPPGSNFDLKHWKLTLPDATASEIKPPQLTTGYTSTNFYTGRDGAMTFWAPVTGGTTANSTYPRSELRELIVPDNSRSNWTVFGTHTLRAQCRVLQAPSTGKVIIGQIHGYEAQPLVKLQWNSGKVDVYIRDVPGQSDTRYNLLTLGSGQDLIDYQIQLVDGVVNVTANGAKITRNVLATGPGWSNITYYFKAGAYVQDNVWPSTEGGTVAFYQLSATHGTNEPPPPVAPPAAPAITVPPRSQAVLPGSNVLLQATVTGSTPMHVQWRTNGTRIAGATNTSLTLLNHRTPQLNADLVASNAAGVVTSAAATVYLNTPTRFVSRKLDTTGRLISTLVGAADVKYVLETSTNLTAWTPAATNSSSVGIVNYTNARTHPRQFFRARRNS
jgi:hypothetical protein